MIKRAITNTFGRKSLYYRFDFLINFIPSVKIRKSLYKLLKKNFYFNGMFVFNIDYNNVKESLLFTDPPSYKDKYALAINFLDIVYPFLDENDKLKIKEEIEAILKYTFTGMAYEYSAYVKKCLYNLEIPKKSWIWEGPYINNSFKLNKNDLVLDIGANQGLFTIFASKIVGSCGKIYSFEPLKTQYELLETNLKINEIKNVEIIKKAVGNKKTNVSFKGMAVYNENEGNIESTTIDEFVKAKKIQRIDFIKMDAEGYERKILLGGFNSLKTNLPNLSICIYHLPDDPSVLKKSIHSINSNYRINCNETGKKYFAKYYS